MVTTTGFAFADDITTDDVSVSNGEIFDVKSYSGKLLVYVNFPLDEVNEVNLTFKNKQLRSSLEDLKPTDCTPKGLEVSEYQVYDGLNQTGGTQASTYDNTKDYSAVYTIKATTGFAFAASISTDDVTAICGEVWNVERSDEKTLKVYVNFQAVIDQVSLTIKDRANRTTIADLEPTDITPGGVALERFVVFEGLNQSSGTPIGHTVAYDGDKNYTVGYQLVTVTGFAFADDISTDDVSVSNGELFDVKSYGGKLLVYVNFPADTPTPSEYNIMVANGTASVGAGAAITKAEPGTVVTITANAAAEGKVFDKWVVNSGAVTISNETSATATFTMPAGDVKITAIYKDTVIEVIDQISLTIKDKSERTILADFEPTAYTPNDKITYDSLFINEGLNQSSGSSLSGSSEYNSEKDYSARYLINVKSGYKIAEGFSEDNVTISNGEVWNVKRMNDTAWLIYVNFPAETSTPTEYNIAVTNGTASFGDGVAITKAEPGTTVAITANTPAEGKAFDKWVVNSGAVTISNETSATATFTMPAGHVQITATYKNNVVNHISLTIKGKTERTTISDFTPAAYAPDQTITVSACFVYEGLNKKGVSPLEETAAYSQDKDYSALYAIATKNGYVLAEGFNKNNVTISEGEVWNVERMEGITGDILFVYVNFPANTSTPTEYNIAVTNGTASVGAGAAITKAEPGTVVTITANAPAEGKVFDKWVVNSGTATINDAASATTTFTMPAGDVNITATYKAAGTTPDPVPTYALTVVNGTGSGSYEANATVNITADTPATGKVFDKWVLKSGDAIIIDVNSASTTVTTKAEAATIEATYKNVDTPIPPAHVHNLVHKDKKEASCSEAGYKEHYQCTDCGLIFADKLCAVKLEASDIVIPAAGHVWNSTYSYDADGHWTSCTVCGEVSEKTAHTFNGSTCLICGYQKNTSSSSDSSHNSDSDGDSGNSGSSGSSYSSSTRSRKAATGIWIQDEKGWWYKFSNGTYPRNGWAKLPWQGIEYWYYFDADGYMKMGWLESSGSYYYLNPIIGTNSGKMLTGWQLIDQKWYYFSTQQGAKEGSLLRNTVTPDNYQVDQDGVWKQ